MASCLTSLRSRSSPVTRLSRLLSLRDRTHLHSYTPLSIPIPIPIPILARNQSSTIKMADPDPDRTYESALRHLDSIQSNRHVTSLFSTPPPSTSSSNPPAQDLNAQAIPEMLSWLSRAGLTQASLASSRLRCIHVAGTKGKGSVCAYLTSILLSEPAAAAGRVGTYTSPHLVSVRERIQLDGRPISRPLFAQYFFEVWDAFTASARALSTSSSAPLDQQPQISEEELQGPATKPFYFRFLTILALHAFLREGVRSAVVECGIGGEYDSTNILPAESVTASVVTRLGVDHVGMLGATVPEIAWHKAGVCKPGRKCFALRAEGEDAEDTMRVLRDRAAEKKAVLVEVDAEGSGWQSVRSETGSLEGDFQRGNQALALLAAAEHLRVLEANPDKTWPGADSESLEALSARFATGLRSARLRGRCETLRDGSITWFIDGAHTSESLAETAAWFARKYEELPNAPKPVLLFNQQERDVAKLLGSLQEGIEKRLVLGSSAFSYAVFTRNDLRPGAAGESERDLSVQRTAAEAMERRTRLKNTIVTDNVSEAVERIRAIQRDEGVEVVVLATGSLHLVGALLRTLEPDGEL
ncbi:FolC bifunctional protein [Hypoxylon sp. FL1150]|nr:FolC bifunctional protein [Hypoxylon sp. FL1150]